MKFCPNCGTQVEEGLSFCPNCGNAMNGQPNNANMNQNNNPGGAMPRPLIEGKNIVTAIILLFVTCGIYGIIWFINIVDSVNAVCRDEKSSQSGGVVFLLNLVTCGIYGYIWFYQAGKRMEVAGKRYGMQISDNSLVYLLLSIFGLGIVTYALLQSDLNKFSNQQ